MTLVHFIIRVVQSCAIKMTMKYLIREWLVMLPLIFHHLAIGFVLSYPAILIPAIIDTHQDDGMNISIFEASWIAGVYSLTGGISFLVLPPLMQYYGRRVVNAVMNANIFLGWIIIVFSHNATTLIIGRAVQGLSFGGLYICSILAGEYSHPKRRGFFIIFKITATSVGELICHGLGFTLSWRQMAWLASIPPAIAVFGTLFWPESPSWLAYKGEYDGCIKSVEWIRGRNVESTREVQELITAQKEIKQMRGMRNSGVFLRNLRAMKSKEFLKPFTVVLLLITLTQVCGRHYLLAYVVQIMMLMTGDMSKAYYYTIGLDVMKIVAILTSSYLVQIFRRRTLLLSTATLACILLSLVCTFQLLMAKNILILNWLTPLLLIVYNLTCYVGVIPVSMVLKGELFPIEYKGLGTSILGIFYALTSMALMLTTGMMLISFDTHGTLAIYLMLAIPCLVCLYYILPETKDRTLQDIESEFIGIKLSKDENEMNAVGRNLLVSP